VLLLFTKGLKIPNAQSEERTIQWQERKGTQGE